MSRDSCGRFAGFSGFGWDVVTACIYRKLDGQSSTEDYTISRAWLSSAMTSYLRRDKAAPKLRGSLLGGDDGAAAVGELGEQEIEEGAGARAA